MPEKGGLSPPNANRSKAVARPTARSRVSNGKDMLLEGVGGRSVLARRYRNILAQLVSDLGGDPSEAQSIIARRATTLAVWREQTEAKPRAGEVCNVTEFTRHECPSPPSQ